MANKQRSEWYVLPKRNADPEGNNLAMDNFRSEDKAFPEILVRELGQNVLDARSVNPSDGNLRTVTLKINVFEVSSGFDFKKLEEGWAGVQQGITHSAPPGQTASSENNTQLTKALANIKLNNAIIINEFSEDPIEFNTLFILWYLY